MTVFLDLVGFGIFMPVLPLIAREYGASDSAAIAISSVYSIGTLLSVAVLGRWSDHVGRKKLILPAIAVSAVAQLLTGLAPSFPILLAVRFMAGIAAGSFAVAQACIADVTQPHERGRKMTLIGAALGLGFSLGPALGAVISLFFKERTFLALAVVASFLNVINFLIVAISLPETHPRFSQPNVQALQRSRDLTASPAQHQSWWQDLRIILREKPMRIVLGLCFLQVFAFIGVESTLPFILHDAFQIHEAHHQYLAFMYLGVMLVLISATLTRPLLQKLGEVRVLNLSQISNVVVMLGLIPMAPRLPGLYFLLTFLALASAFYSPSMGSLVSRLGPEHGQGFTLGLSQTLAALARIIGPLFFGICYQTLGGFRSLALAAFLMTLCFLMSIIGLHGTHRRLFRRDR
jgi:MFS family permease